jgi:type IV pilus assembly protein PilY1
MVFHKARNFALSVAATVLVLGSATANADDTEIFRGNPSNLAAPNIMLILDTSGSMGSNTISPIPYDRNFTYAGTGDCSGIANRVYWSTNNTVPGCDSGNWFDIGFLKCQAALSATALGTGGSGAYLDRFVRWRGSSTSRTWQTLSNNSNPREVECRADNGTDGNLTASDPYPRIPFNSNNTSTNGVWTSTAGNSVWTNNNAGTIATLYSGNYISYYEQFRVPSVLTRMDVMKDAATRLLSALNGVNVGLMRYSRNGNEADGDLAAEGGMVAYPISPIDTNRQQLIDAVNSWNASGFTPLSETLFEAYRYFTGGAVGFGDTSVPFLSVAESRNPATADGDNYESPADFSCQKNYIVYLTDGLPTSDGQSNTDIQALTDFATLGGTCDAANSGPEPDWPNSGLCLVPLAGYMYNADLRGTIDSKQNVTSYWIGFGSDVAGGDALDYLNRTAQAGSGGQHNAFLANDAESLTTVLTGLALQILQTSTTFTAPTVAVNAFNRTRSLSDLYVSVFQPTGDRHWPGNLKKYSVKALSDGSAMVVGQNGSEQPSDDPAINDATGFFFDEAQSFWSAVADGPRVRDGGAAHELPEADVRNVYTYIGANPTTPALLTADASEVVDGNTLITDAMLQIATPAPDDPTRASIIDWIRGKDVRDQYPIGPPVGNGDRTERRRAMGDPIHAQPAIVIYGGTVTTPNINDAVAYVPTNDGFLHAVDTATGQERWAFIPQEFIPLQYDLMLNNVGSGKSYALDGEIQVLKFDVNGDGIVTSSAGDRVLIYFGMGRGGDGYYAFDVTDKDAPRFMWRIGAAELAGVGQTWSPPAIGRVNVNGATQNSQKLVLIMGGGYDTVQDGAAYATDGTGNRIFMVDALSGALLWSAGPSGADLNRTRMTHGFPAGITVLDINSDGFSDRMYAGDMSAQLWRFDITNGNARGSLVAGGVIASLGSHDESPHLAVNNRRFYNSPDVAAIVQPGAPPFLNVAIGSGYRGHPLNQTIQDRFYSIRDLNGFVALTQTQYDALTIITESTSTLVDITTDLAPNMPADSVGWRLNLNQPGGTWRGEKVLGEATTINNAIVFTTYTPSTGIPADPCAPTLGTNRAYAVKVRDGSPVRIDGAADVTDRYDDFTFGGIAGDISMMVLSTDPVPCTGDDCEPECEEGEDCPPPPSQTGLVCLAGVRVLDICRDFDSRVKTYWRETSAN